MDRESQDTSSSLRRNHSFKVMRVIYLHGISQNWLPGKVAKADDSPKPSLWWALLKFQGKIPRKYRRHSQARPWECFKLASWLVCGGCHFLLQSPEEWANPVAAHDYNKAPVVPGRQEAGITRQCLQECHKGSNKTLSKWVTRLNRASGLTRGRQKK